MANEITVTSSLFIQKRSDDGTETLVEYQSRPTAFQADMEGAKGPTPGAIAVSRFGTDISLAELDHPGFCRFRNLDDANPIEIGIYNTDQSEFYPFLRLLPGESYVLRLSPNVNREYAGTGTGTTSEVNTFRAISENADGVLLVEAFEV